LKHEKKNQYIILIFILSLCVIPAQSGAAGMKAVPLWSDTVGNYSIPVACSDNGSTVIAGSDSGLIKLYDGAGKNIWSYQVAGGSVNAVSVSGDGGIVAAAVGTKNEGELLVFDHGGNILFASDANSTVNRVAVSENGRTIIFSDGSTLFAYDPAGKFLGKETSGGTIWDVAVSGDGGYGTAAIDLGWAERKGKIVVFNRSSSRFLDYPTVNQGNTVGVSGDGSSVVGTDDYHLYSIFPNGTQRWNFFSSPPFRAVGVSSDGRYIAAGSQYYLRFFNGSGSLLWQDQVAGYVTSVSASAAGDYVIEGSSDQIRLFDRSGNLLWYYDHGASSVSATKDGRYYVAGSSGRIYFFDLPGMGTSQKDSNPQAGITETRRLSPLPGKDNLTQVSSLPVSIIFFTLCFTGMIFILRKRRFRKLKNRK
jgi:WD40 repeat protein